MAANPKSISLSETVQFTLNGEALEAMAQETILQAAKRVGIEIPYLCYKEGYRPDGNCRVCMVEIKGERVLAPACCRKPSEGMEVWSDNERARHSQTMILELLLSDMPGQGKSPYTPRSELDHWAERLGVVKPRFPGRKQPRGDLSHPAIAVNLDLVVQDIFFTETAGFADVVLPASAFPEKTGTFTNTDRRVQLGRQAIDPPGDARQDLWIIEELARRLGLAWNYAGPAEVFAEIRKAVPSMAGITWERLEREDSVTYPCEKEGDPGEPVLFQDGFPTYP
jgi:predicted molibdopterin-dependent oxidoreductase YjgC